MRYIWISSFLRIFFSQILIFGKFNLLNKIKFCIYFYKATFISRNTIQRRFLCTTVTKYPRILHGLVRGTSSSQVKARRGIARPGSRCVQRSSSFRGRDVPNSLAITVFTIVIVARSILATVLCSYIDKQVYGRKWEKREEAKFVSWNKYINKCTYKIYNN